MAVVLLFIFLLYNSIICFFNKKKQEINVFYLQEVLILNNIGLEELTEGVFSSLKSLEVLVINGNNISLLQHNIFNKLNKIVTLNLQNNFIKVRM